jgi:hypothetical protein
MKLVAVCIMCPLTVAFAAMALIALSEWTAKILRL